METAVNLSLKPEITWGEKNVLCVIFNNSKFPVSNAWSTVQNSQSFTSLNPGLNNTIYTEFMRKENPSSGKKNITFSAKGKKMQLEMVVLVCFVFFKLCFL